VGAGGEAARHAAAASALFCFYSVLVSVHASSPVSPAGDEPGPGWITRRSCRVRLRRMKFR
jgi:hypothetical protein